MHKKTKKLIITFTFVLLLAVVTTSSALAELPGTGWWSALFVQNLASGSVDGTLNMMAYPSASGDTSTYGSDSFLFDYGQGLIYDPGKSPDYSAGTGTYVGFSSSLPSGFEGSVVVSSSVPVAAISEIANYSNGGLGGGGTASARYQGMSTDTVSTTLMIPTIKSNYVNHTTTLYVQAAGADSDVVVTFNMNDGSSYPAPATILANKMFVFDPAAAGVPTSDCGYDSNISPCFGSAVINGSTPVAATVVEHPHTGSPAGYALSTRGQTPGDQSSTLFFPNVKNEYWGKMTAGASVMNVGINTANVKITVTVNQVDNTASSDLVGQQFIDYELIEPGSSILFSKWRDNLGGLPKGTFASAVVESVTDGGYTVQPLVGSTNDSKVANVPGGLGITLYYGFAFENATSYIAAPIIREMNGDTTGGLTVQNVSEGPTQIVFKYYEYGTDNVYTFWTTEALEQYGAVSTNQIYRQENGGKFSFDGTSGFESFAEFAGKQFSVIAYSPTGENIFGLASEYSISEVLDMRNYEAINFYEPLD